MSKRIKKTLSLIMALVITFTSLNLTDVGTIKAHAEEINDEVVSSVSDGEIINDDTVNEIIGEESKKDVSSLATGLYMADWFRFNGDRHPDSFGDSRPEGETWFEEFNKINSPQTVGTITHYAFRFYDATANTFTALTMADLTVTKSDPNANDFSDQDEPSLHYDLDGEDDQDYQIYELVQNVECTYTISYTDSGTTYSVKVVVGLPMVAFYSSNVRNANNLINGEYLYSKNNNKIYLLTDGTTSASDYSFNYQMNWNPIPAGGETNYVSVSPDNSEITLKSDCDGLRIGIVDNNNGNEIWSVFINAAPTSGLRFMNEIDWRRDFEDNIDVIEIWEDYELDETHYERILPNSQNVYIFGYYDVDNDTYTPISLEDTNVSFNGCADYFVDTNCTVNYKGNDYKVYNFETRRLGEYIVSYYDGSDTSSVKINIVLPEIGFYKTDVRSQENVLFLGDFRYDKKSSEPQNVYVLTDSYTNTDDYYYELRWCDESGEQEIKENDSRFSDFVEVNAARNILTIKASAVNKELRIKKDFEGGGSYIVHEIDISKIEYADTLLVTNVDWFNEDWNEDPEYYLRPDSMFYDNTGFGVDGPHYVVFGYQTGEYDEWYNPVIDSYYRLSGSDLGKLSVKAYTKDVLFEDGTSAGREELETDVTLRDISRTINYSGDQMEGAYNGDYAIFELVGTLENCEYEITYDPDSVPGSGDEVSAHIYVGYPGVALYTAPEIKYENRVSYEYYYESGEKFYVLTDTSSDPIKNIIYEVYVNEKKENKDDYIELLTNSDGIRELTIKEGVNSPFHLVICGYRNDDEEYPDETHYNFYPSKGIMICDWIESYWDYEQGKDVAEFEDYGEYNYSRFNSSIECEVKNTKNMALAYVEKHKDGSVYAEPIDLEACSLTFNGKAVKVSDYFEYIDTAEYSIGGKYDDCPEALNGEYNIYRFCSSSLGTFELTYTKDDKNYVYSFECVLPRVGIYSKNERSLNTLLESFNYSSTNKTVYLLTGEKQYEDQEDLVIDSIEIRNDFENSELSEDEIKEYVTVTKVTNGYKLVFTDKIADYYCIDFRTNYGGCGVEIKDGRPGLRICDWIDMHWDDEAQKDVIDGFHQDEYDYATFRKKNADETVEYNNRYFFALAYVNNNTYKPLKLSDIKVTLNGANVKDSVVLAAENVPYTFDPDNKKSYNVYYLETKNVGDYVISYDPTPSNTTNKDTVTMVVSCSLPEIAAYSDETKSLDSYLGYDIFVNKNNDSFYILSDDIDEYRFESFVYYYSDDREEPAADLEEYFDIEGVGNGRNVKVKKIDTLIESELHLKVLRHDCWEEDESCPGREYCDNYREDRTIFIRKIMDPQLAIYDEFNVDWRTGRFIGFNNGPEFWWPEEDIRDLRIGDDYYVSFTYRKDNGYYCEFTPLTIDKLKVYKEDQEIDPSTVFSVKAKGLAYNGWDQEGLGNKYDVYQLDTKKTGLYTVKYDPDTTNDTEEDVVVLKFRISYAEYSFYSEPEVSDEAYFGSYAQVITAINGENNAVYLNAFNPESSFKLYTVNYNEEGYPSLGELLFNSESPADAEFEELGIRISVESNGMIKIYYNGVHNNCNVVVYDENAIQEWNPLGTVAEVAFFTLNILDGNIKSTCAVGEEVKKDKLYIDYFDENGMFSTISAADIEKLGYSLKFEYAEFMPEPYTVEPTDGKLILTVPGIYKWNLYKDDQLYANGNNCVQVFKKVYTPALGTEIEIEGVKEEEYESEEDIMRGYAQAVKIVAEAGMTYRITAYPSDNTVTDYDRFVNIEGFYYNEENDEMEYGSIGVGTTKYIFFRAQSDGDVLIMPFAGCKEKIKIEKYPEIEEAEIIAPDDFEFWSDGERFIGSAPEDVAKVLVYTESGTEEYSLGDALSLIRVDGEDFEPGKAGRYYQGSVGYLEIAKEFTVVVLPDSPEINVGESFNTNGFHKINLEENKYYELLANPTDDGTKRLIEAGLRILLMYLDEEGNVEYVIDRDALSVNVKVEESGTYYLLIEGLDAEASDEFYVLEGKKSINEVTTKSDINICYGNNPVIDDVVEELHFIFGEESPYIISFGAGDTDEKAALNGFTYDLVKADKTTIAKKDASGFYPAGKYYYRITLDTNYDVDPVYSNEFEISKFSGKYNIVYHSNGKTTTQKDIAANKAINLKANAEKKNGYTFLGWNVVIPGLSEEGEDVEVIIRDEDELPLNFYTDKEKVSNLFIPEVSRTTHLYAVWGLNTYTIEYHSSSETDSYEIVGYTVEDDSVELLIPEVTDPAYSGFDGWYTDKNYTNKVTEIKPSDAKNYVLYAKFNRTSYTINFDANGGTGTQMSSLTVYDGMEITIPNCSYKKTGYGFCGWATDAEGGDPINSAKVTVKVEDILGTKHMSFKLVDNDPVELTLDANNNATLYASWLDDFYIVYHNITEEDVYTSEDVSKDVRIKYNEKNDKLVKPARNGYTFAGWYDENGKKVTSITAKGEKFVYNLYPRWTAKSYEVTFNKNDATSGTMSKQKLTYDKAAVLSTNKFVRPGYVFCGWSKVKLDPLSIEATEEEIAILCNYSDKEEVTNVSATGANITLYAVWQETNYTITLDPVCISDEIEGDLSPVTYSYSKTEGVTLPQISRDGYEFKGWYKDAKYSKAVSSTKGLYADMTVYAKWAVTYDIVFYGNGATGTTKTISKVKLNEAKKLTKNGFTYKDEFGNKYAFMGWGLYPGALEAEFANEEKIKISSPDYLSEESGKYVLNLYAIWRRSFNVGYELNGGSVGDLDYMYLYGTGIKTLPTPVRDGYTFGGWYKDEKFKTKVTSISATSAGDIILYAKWTGNKYTITFNANAPEGAKASGKMKAESMVFGTDKALTKNAFKVTGYKFVGWSKNPTSPVMPSDEFEPEYANAEKVGQLSYMYKNKETLYAVWEYVPSYVTVYVSGAEDFSYNIVDESRIGETITLDEINAVFRDENGSFYFYDKLYTDKACKKLFKGTKITSGEIKLYAKKRTQILY